jgi:hypothetical protein
MVRLKNVLAKMFLRHINKIIDWTTLEKEIDKVIYKMKISCQWFCSEITQKMQKLFNEIGIDYLT